MEPPQQIEPLVAAVTSSPGFVIGFETADREPGKPTEHPAGRAAWN
jgi:hypothetical protein